MQAITKLSMSLKSTLLGEKSQKYQKHKGGRAESTYASSGHRSAEEQIPASTSFVKLSDMSEEEWTMFLEKYQELLYPAFAKRKATESEAEAGNFVPVLRCHRLKKKNKRIV